MSVLISSLTLWLFSSMLSNLPMFVNFPVLFMQLTSLFLINKPSPKGREGVNQCRPSKVQTESSGFWFFLSNFSS